MTPEQLAARWLADVPTWQFSIGGHADPTAFVIRNSALAAIARHLAPGDDLVERATAALEGVTEGPWKAAYSTWGPNNFIVQTDHPCRRVLAQFGGDGDGPDDQSLADARFIAFTRQWVPEAAARIAAMTATVAELQGALEMASIGLSWAQEHLRDTGKTSKTVDAAARVVAETRAALTDGGSNG